MKKKGHRPITRVKNPEPNIESPDWVIWAAWADRITFEEIKERTDKWTPKESKYKTGVLAKYAKLVSSASDGAICK